MQTLLTSNSQKPSAWEGVSPLWLPECMLCGLPRDLLKCIGVVTRPQPVQSGCTEDTGQNLWLYAFIPKRRFLAGARAYACEAFQTSSAESPFVLGTLPSQFRWVTRGQRKIGRLAASFSQPRCHGWAWKGTGCFRYLNKSHFRN